MDLPLWFAYIFPWNISSAYYGETTQNDRNRCLIDAPEVTMSHPIIDFDVHRTCDIILKSAKEPVFAVVRGMGSGKTRCFEEIRRELLKRPGVLPLGVTFNALQSIDPDELKWGNNHQTAFAFMVIARCCSALFDIALDDIRNLIARELPKLKVIGTLNIGSEILLEFLRFIVGKMRSQGKDVNDVVVIIDEILNAEKDLFKKYGVEKQICSILQDAILDPQTVSLSFNSTVCISSLNIKVLGKNLTGRRVNALDIPSALNPTRILKEWWRCTKEDERIMLYVAACVNSLPRAVEMIQIYLERNSNRPKDSSFMKDLFEYLKISLAGRYIWDTFPDDNVLYSILFAKEIKLDSDVQRLVARSILLNSIETSLEEEASIVPISSLTVLAGCQNQEIKVLQRHTIKLYSDLLQEIVVLAGKGSTEGIPSGFFFANWMRYRWNVASTSKNSVCLGEFLGIRNDRLQNIPEGAIKNALSTIFTTSGPVWYDFSYLTINSRIDPAEHLREIYSIKVNEMSPVATRKGANGDIFDLLIIIFQSNGLKPLLIYIDHKSAKPDNPESVDDNNSTSMKQYNGVKETCEAANVPFIFCYWTHDPGFLQTFNDTDDCFVLKEEECKSFFGPMWPIYIACNSAFEI